VLTAGRSGMALVVLYVSQGQHQAAIIATRCYVAGWSGPGVVRWAANREGGAHQVESTIWMWMLPQ
jgi:hypothetical protein